MKYKIKTVVNNYYGESTTITESQLNEWLELMGDINIGDIDDLWITPRFGIKVYIKYQEKHHDFNIIVYEGVEEKTICVATMEVDFFN